jgi:hypothetical protein
MGEWTLQDLSLFKRPLIAVALPNFVPLDKKTKAGLEIVIFVTNLTWIPIRVQRVQELTNGPIEIPITGLKAGKSHQPLTQILGYSTLFIEVMPGWVAMVEPLLPVSSIRTFPLVGFP